MRAKHKFKIGDKVRWIGHDGSFEVIQRGMITSTGEPTYVINLTEPIQSRGYIAWETQLAPQGVA